jgi:hypothetical protein
VSQFEFAKNAKRKVEPSIKALRPYAILLPIVILCCLSSRDNPARDFGGISLTLKLRNLNAQKNHVIAPTKETIVGKLMTIDRLYLPVALNH